MEENVSGCFFWTQCITTQCQCQTPIFCTPLSSKTPTKLQPVGSLKVGRYIS